VIRRDLTELLVFPAGSALGPFVVGSVVVALLSVIGGISMARHQARTTGRTPDADRRQESTVAGDDIAGR
jgi:hypothetical protein